jgi:phosphoribosyl-AMP cyclohydrolase
MAVASQPDLSEIRFDERGLVPAIAQAHDTGRVLMVGWMNADTLRETLEIGRMVYWSRSRQERWAKGDTSGDIQLVREAYYDCDGDVLLFVVDQQGKGACHTGEYSCFYRRLEGAGGEAGGRPASIEGAGGEAGRRPASIEGAGGEAGGRPASIEGAGGEAGGRPASIDTTD